MERPLTGRLFDVHARPQPESPSENERQVDRVGLLNGTGWTVLLHALQRAGLSGSEPTPQ